jgi:ABC-2 type transport system ATP-binding protein
MIRFQAVSKSYGHVEAVKDLTLEVPAGELFGFLGPNGAGKTTTIKMATGMLRPTSGRILIAGHDVYEDGNAARSLIGYVPDRPYVYDKLSGREFLEFVADLYSVDPRQSRPRGSELLELFGLSEHGEQLLESYSHGMRQKLIMASVLIHDPRVVFLDEPTTALDPRSARLVKEILRGLCERGATVFMSTQVMEIAERMCDRVAIIDRGELVATGTIEELRRAETSREPGKGSLEDVFLSLTDGAEASDWVHILGEPES